MTTDAITSAIQLSLHGLADRQHVTDDNLSNIETPGYIAKRSDFEDSLKAALNGNTSVDVNPVHSLSQAPTRTDGNNVDIDNETVTAIDTELKYQAMIEAMNTKFKTLRSAIG
jgi:flagellar basal-body rod protein FlgB